MRRHRRANEFFEDDEVGEVFIAGMGLKIQADGPWYNLLDLRCEWETILYRSNMQMKKMKN
jgi:hypothetical protein